MNVAGNVRVHPEYTLRGWLREDYAVIELDQSITAVAKVTPIPVETPHNIPFAGETLTLVGYGLTGTDCQGPGLGKMKMDVPIAVSGWGGISFKNDTLHACPGDSGGPVLNSNKHVVGVASWVSVATVTALTVPLRMHITGFITFHSSNGVHVHGFLSSRAARTAINRRSFARMAVS